MRQAAVIVGAQGAIGHALCAQLRDAGEFHCIYATSRHPPSASSNNLHWLALDLEDAQSMAMAATQVKTQLQADGAVLTKLVICSGILHDQHMRPERRLQALDPAAFEKSLRINALGPLLVAQAFVPLLPRKQFSQLAAISARVGSIRDNRLGGWYSYRCSKAALNMAFQTLAVEMKRTHPHCVLTLFQPGTVDSPLSKPFQAGVPPKDLFKPEQAARQFEAVLAGRRDPAEHIFVDWAGQPVPF